MNCGFPVEVGSRFRPCGKCQGCLRRRRNAWVGRMLMEQNQHSECAFVTLTYEDDHLPIRYHREHDLWMPTLVKSHLQSFLRSVRKKATRIDRVMRYFAAGEYGDKSGRPHYHAILFGTGPFWIDAYRASWRYGFVSAYEATPRSMSYVAKYCLKGGKDPELDLPEYGEYSLENDRTTQPPFRLTSRKPPIGGGFAPDIANSLKVTLDAMGPSGLSGKGKSATTIRLNGAKYPLDRTTKDHIARCLEGFEVPYSEIDAILHPDFGDPTDEQTKKGREAHIKALITNTRNRRQAKL